MKNFVVWAILLFTITFFGACDMPQNLPVRFFADDSLSGEQYDTVQEAVSEWNNKAGALLDPPQDVLFLEGFYSSDQDPDTDGAHVVYYPRDVPKNLFPSKDAFGFYQRVVFAPNSEDLYVFYGRIENYRKKGAKKIGGNYSEEDILEWHLDMFLRVVLHEMGHSIGFNRHIKADVAVMQYDIGNVPTHLTKDDLEQFCKIYSCK